MCLVDGFLPLKSYASPSPQRIPSEKSTFDA